MGSDLEQLEKTPRQVVNQRSPPSHQRPRASDCVQSVGGLGSRPEGGSGSLPDGQQNRRVLRVETGGARSRSSTNIAESIFRLVESLGLCISAAYLPGERNVLADMLSRQGQILKTEWKLSLLTFQWCCRRSPFGQPQVDLFANSMNHLLPRFFSPCIDTGAEAVDALSANWPQAVLYAFPPPTILDRVVVKLHQEKPQRLILVAPLHTVAAWYPTLRFHAQWVERIP